MIRSLRGLGPDLGVLCASVIAAAAVARLFKGDLGGQAFAPLLVTTAVGSAVPSLLAVKRVPLPFRAIAATVAVILTSLWTTVANATTSGFPTAHTWHVVQTDLRAARPLLAAFSVPLRAAPGLMFLAAMTCGVVGMTASVLLRVDDRGDRLYPGLALVCPFGLLAFACAEGTSHSMGALVVLFVAAGALTLATARPRRARQTAPDRLRSWTTPAALAAYTMAGVVLVAVLVNSGAEGAGSSRPGVAPVVPLSAESLTSNLLSVEVHDANDVLFHASGRYRTYWQVAVLNVLRDGVWVPDPLTENAAHGSPNGEPASQSPSGAGPSGNQYFKADVQIDDLASRILPVPPGTVALSGTPATLTSVGAVSPTPTTSGQQYTTLSAVPVAVSASLGAAAPVTTDPPALVLMDTALPALPPSIGDLARSATVGAQGQLAQAELLVNWFRSGQFHYTLDPPASPPGTDPLISFLTQTKSGSCEQFAGAYVVLARSLGLPSRVVVGFTAGRYGGPGQVTVRGADAHAWPEVYLGPRAGWVSFEPTPQQPRGELAPEGVVGPSGVTSTVPSQPTGSGTTPSSPTLSVPTTLPASPGPNSSASSSTATPASGSGLGIVGWTLVGGAALLVGALAALFILRRRRWSPVGRTPDELALLAQAEVVRAFRHAGVEPPVWQPLDLFFEDLSSHSADGSDVGTMLPSPASERTTLLIADGIAVAHAADAALFDPLATSGERSRAAYEAALRVREELKAR